MRVVYCRYCKNYMTVYINYLLENKADAEYAKIWQNSQENSCARISFLIKLQAPLLQNTS